jgi:hypothetical protein
VGRAVSKISRKRADFQHFLTEKLSKTLRFLAQDFSRRPMSNFAQVGKMLAFSAEPNVNRLNSNELWRLRRLSPLSPSSANICWPHRERPARADFFGEPSYFPSEI